MTSSRKLHHWLAHACAGVAAGAALGWGAWGGGRVPVLALALPLLVAFSRSRLQAFCVAFGYALGVLRFAPSFIASWFDGNMAIGLAAVAAYALIAGLVWSCGWSGSSHLWVRQAAISGAWLLALAACIGVPGHPLIAAGFVLPGTGWAGAGIALGLPACALLAAHKLASSRGLRGGALLAVLACLAIAGLALFQPPPEGTVPGVHAQRTAWGALRGEQAALLRMQWMGAARQSPVPATVVWPESILGRYEPALYPVLEIELLRESRREGRTQIIGMDIPLVGNRMLNAAVAFYPDGRTATAVARQPAPLSLWKPWRSTETFIADWSARNMLDLGQGDRAAVIFCYEEYLPLLYLLNEARDDPTAYVALTNTWAAQSEGAALIQTWHSLGMARLFARPYLKAENRPSA
ncbi:conjugal transfer protein TraB [Ramlibacter sp. AN1133]|uniref:conjugal transfer protein TraB n=1 Tax=Ramlibacter sp. AN1133 TaxID=3133429 RepID=UPI0030BE926D